MAQPSPKDIADYSSYLVAQGNKPEDVKAYADYLAGHHGVESPSMSGLDAAKIGGESGALLGLRPVVAGLGAAAGDISGQLGGNSPYKFSQTVDAFKTGRTEANAEQNLAHEQHPAISTATDLAGSLITLPFLPAKGLAGAVKLGAGLGAAQAAGSANSLGEAAADTVGGAALGGAGYGVAKGLGALAGSELAQKASSKTKEVLKKIALSTPAELTGVPDKEIEAYATRADKVSEIIKNNMSEGRFDTQLAANHMKENIVNDVQRTRKALNSQIEEALKDAPKDPIFSTDPIKQALSEHIGQLDPVYDEKQIKKIGEIISTIDKKSPSGKVNIQDLQKTKEYLYDIASGAYKQSSEFFQIGGDVANAAKKAGGVTRKILDADGPEAIRNANRQLAQLHDVEDSMGPSLLDKTASASSLYSVGAGSNPRDTLALQKLGGITGKNYIQGATDLSAARSFANPPLFNSLKTGRSYLGTGVGGAVGGAVGGLVGGAPGAIIGGKYGAAIGAAISSPAALKLAINTGRITGKMLAAVADATGVQPQNLNALYEVLQKPQVQEILIRSMSGDNQAAAGQESAATATERRLQQLKQSR